VNHDLLKRFEILCVVVKGWTTGKCGLGARHRGLFVGAGECTLSVFVSLHVTAGKGDITGHRQSTRLKKSANELSC
jgi:hypothetical protein